MYRDANNELQADTYNTTTVLNNDLRGIKYQAVMNLRNFIYINNQAARQQLFNSTSTSVIELGSLRAYYKEYYDAATKKTYKMPGRVLEDKRTNLIVDWLDYDEQLMQRDLKFNAMPCIVDLPADVTVDIDKTNNSYLIYKSKSGNIKLQQVLTFRCGITYNDAYVTMADVDDINDANSDKNKAVAKSMKTLDISDAMCGITDNFCGYDCRTDYSTGRNAYSYKIRLEPDDVDESGDMPSYVASEIAYCSELKFKLINANNDTYMKSVLILESVKLKTGTDVVITDYSKLDSGFKDILTSVVNDSSVDGSGGSAKLFWALAKTTKEAPDKVTTDHTLTTSSEMLGSENYNKFNNTNFGIFLTNLKIGCKLAGNAITEKPFIQVSDVCVDKTITLKYSEVTHTLQNTKSVEVEGSWASTLLSFGTDNVVKISKDGNTTYQDDEFIPYGITHTLIANGSTVKKEYMNGPGPEGVVINKSTFIKGIKGNFFVANNSYAGNGNGFVVNKSKYSKDNVGGSNSTKCTQRSHFALVINNSDVSPNGYRADYLNATNCLYGLLAVNGSTYNGPSRSTFGLRIVIDSIYDDVAREGSTNIMGLALFGNSKLSIQQGTAILR